MQAGDAELGWRLYVRPSPSSDNDPVVVYCHANAENVADVEHLAPVLHSAGAAAVFAFDYRGYGCACPRYGYRGLFAPADMRALSILHLQGAREHRRSVRCLQTSSTSWLPCLASWRGLR